MMKYLLLCMMLGISVPCMIFSQDKMAAEEVIAPPQTAADPQNGPDAFVLPPLIIDHDLPWVDFLKQSSFFMLDGRYVTYEAMKPLLLTVPGNEKYVRRAKGWEISTWINAGISIGALVGVLVINLVPDIPNKELWDITTTAASLFEMGIAVYSSRLRAANMHRVIKNYNLYIMGVPTP
jgi:hypothetical protein